MHDAQWAYALLLNPINFAALIELRKDDVMT